MSRRFLVMTLAGLSLTANLLACRTTTTSELATVATPPNAPLVGTLQLNATISAEALAAYIASGAPGFYFLDTPENRDLIPAAYRDRVRDVAAASIPDGSVFVARVGDGDMALTDFTPAELAQAKADRDAVTTALSKYPPGTPGAGLANISRLFGLFALETPQSAATARAGFIDFEREHAEDLASKDKAAFERIAHAEGAMFNQAAIEGKLGPAASLFSRVLPDVLRAAGTRFFAGR